ncbi:Glycine cleavage T protein (aminomethyl transferase) [Anopheles sinensis]|uniref:Glycine cleavage T protein (Aminomethyl transferase) n=1 Tax=Anopheles sinensis TaxID=74873 RepID=A0A084W7L8_ANOSI|nr:Glycine cleavage T protein (aminomethyl transferase) [Anopheles sinensis]
MRQDGVKLGTTTMSPLSTLEGDDKTSRRRWRMRTGARCNIEPVDGKPSGSLDGL